MAQARITAAAETAYRAVLATMIVRATRLERADAAGVMIPPAKVAAIAALTATVVQRARHRPRSRRGRQRHGRRREAPASEPRSEQVAGPGQSPAHGRLAHLQFHRRLRMRPRLQVAEDQRPAEPLGQAVDLLVQRGVQGLARSSVAGRVAQLSGTPLLLATATRLDVRPDRDPVRHAMEPGPDRVATPDRPGLADEDEERRLEGILDIVAVAERAPADGQDHWPVPLDKHLESQGVASCEEPIEELPVGLPGDSSFSEQRPDLRQRGARRQVRHNRVSLESMVSAWTPHRKRGPARLHPITFLENSPEERIRISVGVSGDLHGSELSLEGQTTMNDALCMLAALVLVVAPGADDRRSVVLEVDAGRYDRRHTPVVFPALGTLLVQPNVSLERLDNRQPVPVQATEIGTPSVAWILHELLPAGTTRRYRLSVASAPVAAGPLRFTCDHEQVTIDLAGQPVLTYHVAVAEPPPGIDRVFRKSGFIHPLATRSGLVVTDDFPSDHAHQHGLFFAWVNTTFEGRHVDFWNQKSRTGRVAHDEGGPGLSPHAGPVIAEFSVPLRHDDLTAPGGPSKVLDETWVVRAYDVPGLVVLDIESTQTCAGRSSLILNKYHYGGLGLRGNRAWLDPTVKGDDAPDPAKSGHSDFLTSEGKHRSDGNHTRPRWVDLSGEVGGRVGGVAILDHPANFRFPQPVRLHPNKPYFCFAPMVLGDFAIDPGKPYISRYRIIVHDGPPDPRLLDRLWDDYADPPRVRVVAEGK